MSSNYETIPTDDINTKLDMELTLSKEVREVVNTLKCLHESSDSDDEENKTGSDSHGELYMNHILNDKSIETLKEYMISHKYDEKSNLFEDFNFAKGMKILSDIETYLRDTDGENKLFQQIQTMNAGIQKLNDALWYLFNSEHSQHKKKYNEQIRCICCTYLVKWTNDEWISDLKQREKSELYKLLKDKFGVKYDGSYEYLYAIYCDEWKNIPSTKGNDYINPKERTRTIVNNTKNNQNYIKLLNWSKNSYTIEIKGDNESELDIDIGWALMTPSKNNEINAGIYQSWTWNGFRGIKKNIIYEKEEERELKYDPKIGKVPPLQWESGDHIGCTLDLEKGIIGFRCRRYHFSYYFDAFSLASNKGDIFCPVISSVKCQHMYEWIGSTLNHYWAKQNGEKADNTFNCKSDLNENKIDENNNKKNKQKIILKPNMENNKYIPLGDDTYYYKVQFNGNYDETNCYVGWAQLEKCVPVEQWTVNIANSDFCSDTTVSCFISLKKKHIWFVYDGAIAPTLPSFSDINFNKNRLIAPIVIGSMENVNFGATLMVSEDQDGTPLFTYWDVYQDKEDSVSTRAMGYIGMCHQSKERVKSLIKEWNSSGKDNSLAIKLILDTIISHPPRSNNNSFLSAVKLAIFLHRFSEYYPNIQDNINNLAVYCEEAAIQILSELQSNRLKLIYLTASDALDMIIENELKVITSSEEMRVLRHCIWINSTSNIICRPEIEIIQKVPESQVKVWINKMTENYIYSWKSIYEWWDHYFTLKHQYSYFYSPLGCIQLEFISYFVYLLFMVYIAVAVPNMYDTKMGKLEQIYWALSMSFIASELVQFIKNKSNYLHEQTNYADIIIGISTIILFTMRILVTNGSINCIEDIDNDIDTDINFCVSLDPKQILYVNTWFLLLMCSCFRMVYVCSIFESMALLLSNINRMMYDMLNIFVFIMIFVLGFSASLYMASFGENEEITNYSTPIQAFRTTLYGFIDGLDWSEFNNINGIWKSFFIQLWIFLFVIFAVLILLNLIIAIMSSTYENVNDSAKLNVNYNQWKVCYHKSKTLSILPPPLDFIIFVITVILRCILYFINKACKKDFTANMHKLLYYQIRKDKDENKDADEDADEDEDEDENKEEEPFKECKEWICGYCVHKNVVEVDNINGLNNDKDFAFAKKEKNMVNSIHLDLCLNCYQSKNVPSTQHLLESILSFYLLIIFNSSIRIITLAIHLVVFILMNIVVAAILCIPVCFMCCYFKCDKKEVVWWVEETYIYRIMIRIGESFLWSSETRSRIRYDCKLTAPHELLEVESDMIERLYLSDQKEIERFRQCVTNNKPFIIPNCDQTFKRVNPTDNSWQKISIQILHGTDLELPDV